MVENIGLTGYGEAYHGFWTHNIHNINEHFGTADSLKALVKELHRRDMYIMIDVVVNNIAMVGDGKDAVYSDFAAPFNDKKYFHPFKQVVNYGDQLEAQNGWLGDPTVALPDLDTESDYVQNIWHDWTKEMIANYTCKYSATLLFLFLQ